MARMITVAKSKAVYGGTNKQAAPKEGTKLRALFDLFTQNRGIAIDTSHIYDKPRTLYGAVEQLRNAYGMDVICSGTRSGTKQTLVGEWDNNNTYINYLTRKIAR